MKLESLSRRSTAKPDRTQTLEPDRTINRRIDDYTKRTGVNKEKPDSAETLLTEYSISVYSYVMAQHLARRRAFELRNPTGIDEGTFNEETLNSFNQRWKTERRSLEMISGKEALSHLNKKLQEKIGISITPTSIIEAMPLSDVPQDMKNLVRNRAKITWTNKLRFAKYFAWKIPRRKLA